MIKNISKLRSAISVFLTVAVIFGFGFLVGRLTGGGGEIVEGESGFDLKLPGEVEKRLVTREEVEVKLSQIGQLSTYLGSYHVEKQADYSRYFLDDIPIPGTTNTIRIECDGIVKVGYDIDKIVPRVDNVSMKIYIAVPEAYIQDNYVDWDSIVCQEKNNILNPIDFAQYQTLIKEMEELGLSTAIDDGIYEAAKDNVKLVISSFLAGFSDYEIVFM